MRSLPQFEGSPEHLRGRADLRLRLMLCAEELHMRYPCDVYLCGSGLQREDPEDWDVRGIFANEVFDEHGPSYWAMEAALFTTEQEKLQGLALDVRLLPSRLFYRLGALSLDRHEASAAPEWPILTAPSPEEIAYGKEVIEQNKHLPDFHVLLGSVMYARGDKQTALQAFLKAVELEPENHGAWLNVGNILYDWGEFKRAAVYYRRALILKPDYAKGYLNMANVLVQMGNTVSALPFYDQALKIDPEMGAGYHNRGNCLIALKKYDAAEKDLMRALELEPDDERVYNTLGNLRTSQGLEYTAGAAYRTAILVNPKYAPLYTNLANIYANLNRQRDAIVNYERGLILDPKNPGVRYNLALAYLRAGEYRLGWRAYEGRSDFRELNVKKRDFGKPRWDGSPLEGKRILVHCEQGLGDTIQFARYIPLVERMGGKVYFEVQHGLQRLMSTVDGAKMICTRGMPLPEFDLHCPLMSLPAIFKTDIDTVPRNVPYLRAWKWEAEQMWRRYPLRWHGSGSYLRVGISWAGNPKYKKDHERSFSLSEFAPLADVEGVNFYSLQKGPAAQQIEKYQDRIMVFNASENAKDFAESAALIDTLDLVISSDSSPMHLAAAMDKEVWLLLAYLPDWRWIDGEKTPWYPNVKIFRQTSPGDWAGVFLRVRQALEEFVAVRKGVRDAAQTCS